MKAKKKKRKTNKPMNTSSLTGKIGEKKNINSTNLYYKDDKKRGMCV